MRSFQQRALSPSWRTTRCWLSMTAYSMHSELPSISGRCSCISNLRTHHVVVTGTHLPLFLQPKNEIKLLCCLQVLGQWYLAEVISPLPGRSDTCAGIKLIRENDSSWDNLTMVGQESPAGRSIFHENHSIIIPDPVNSPSLWEQPGMTKYFTFKCL